MTRTLTITTAEWAAVTDGTLWLVREGIPWWGGDNEALGYAPKMLPPVEFVQASAACETCGNTGSLLFIPPDCGDFLPDDVRPTPCTDCRIELVGPCPPCDSRAGALHNAYEAAAERHGWATQERSRKPWSDVPEANRATMIDALRVTLGCDSPVPCDGGTVTLGYGYAIGEPLPIVKDATTCEAECLDAWGGSVLYWPAGKTSTATDLTNRLAHYGPPESLVGKWALHLEGVTS